MAAKFNYVASYRINKYIYIMYPWLRKASGQGPRGISNEMNRNM